MKRTSFLMVSTCLALAALTSACSKDSNGKLTANLKVVSSTSSSQSMLQGGSSRLTTSTADDVGMSSAADVLSLKYKIFSISVCESMTVSGTAFSNQSGCLTIYDSGSNNQSGTWAYDSSNMNASTMAQTALSNSSELTDFMDSTSRSKLTQEITLTQDSVRSYNWGVITWYPAVLVKGQVNLGGGVTLATKSSGSFNGSNKWIASSSLASGSAEETPVYTGNGGTWFRFQSPLVITQSDLDNQVAFTVDLAFNPDGYFKGVTANTYEGCGTCAIGDSSNNWMTTPMLDITPIPHKSSQAVKRETYIATVNGATEKYSIRLQLYYLDGDSSKTIYGVNTNTLMTSDSTKFVYDFPKVSYISTNTDGTLDFKLWDNTVKLIQNFTRKSAVNETTTARINCGGNSSGGGFTTTDCPDGSSMDVTFTLTEIGDL